MNKKFKIIIFLSLVSCLLSLSLPVHAACEPTPWLSQIGIKEGSLIPCKCRTGEGECGLNEVMQTVVNFSQLILGVMGSLALLMFIYGGMMFIIAGGNEEKIGAAKKILTNAVIGIALILGAWLIVNFTIFALTGGEVGNVTIFGKEWFKPGG